MSDYIIMYRKFVPLQLIITPINIESFDDDEFRVNMIY